MWVDAKTGTALLQYLYYTSYLAPLAIVAFVAQAGPPPGGRDPRAVIGFEIGTLLALLGMHLLMFRHGAFFWRFWDLWHGLLPRDPVAVVTTAMGLVAILGLIWIPHPNLRWAVFVLGVTLSFGGLLRYWSTEGIDGPAEFENVVSAHRFIAVNTAGRAFRLWHAPPTVTAPPFRAIACTFLCNRWLINEDLPRLTRQEGGAIPPAVRLVVMVNTQTEAEEAHAALHAFGLDYIVVAQEAFGQSDRRFLVIIANVVPAPGPQVARGDGSPDAEVAVRQYD